MTSFDDKNSPFILIADDDRFTRMMLRQMMEKEGYKIEEVTDGEQCLAAYRSHKPDIVLLDAMMPVMDGFTCCRLLQTLSGDDLTPVLMITGLNDQASVDWAFEAGATDFVTKPIHPPVLLRRVRRLIEASSAEKALRESEKKYRSVVENVKEVIFQTDATGSWTFLNPAWTNLTGFTVEESLGTNFLNYVHCDDQQRQQQLWQSLIRDQKGSCRYEMRYLTKAGECRWIEVHGHPTLVTDGAVTGISGMLRDITERVYAQALEKDKVRLETEIIERKRTEEIIRSALEKEKELGELQSRIIATISHEFRTPLTTVQSSSDLLKNYGKTWSDEKRYKHFHRIDDSVEHMTQLLNDVILIGQAEAGKLQFNPTPLELESLCREIVEEWQLSLDSKQDGQGGRIPTVALSVQGNETQAKLDEKLLRQILTNLLSNASKFSPQTGIVRFDLICQEHQAIFRIQDEGIGIPLEDQPRLFESFYRASNVGTTQGTGLGLAIVKKCVDLHQGQITVESEVGVGTTFTLTLPLNPIPTPQGNS
ncbi:MAG TPA: ATP-binding protein [Coleofasciculaceae cyanobacterium]|jgi:PAS domain S-box-containing protein